MLIHVHFLWNHIDILLAAVMLVIVIKTLVVATVVKGFRYNNKSSLLVGRSLAQIGEFAFVLLSRASNVHLVEGKLYLLLLGTTALSLILDRRKHGLNSLDKAPLLALYFVTKQTVIRLLVKDLDNVSYGSNQVIPRTVGGNTSCGLGRVILQLRLAEKMSWTATMNPGF